MPFQQRTTPLPSNAPVTIYFHGLNILRSPDGRSCHVDIHYVPDREHTLSVEVRVKGTDDRPDEILMRHFGELRGRDPGLIIETVPPVGDPGAFKYVPFNLDPFNTEPTKENLKHFGWVVDLESHHYHQQPLMVEEPNTRPSAVLRGGLFHFYTAARLPGPIPVKQGGGNEKQLQGLASIIGAVMELPADCTESDVLITCNRLGTLRLEKPVSSGISYEIYIDNSPLLDDPAASTHDEMNEYYKVIKRADGSDIPPNQRFKIEVPRPKTVMRGGAEVYTGTAKVDAGRGSARIPCQSIVLEG